MRSLDANRSTGDLGKNTLDMDDFYRQSKALMDTPNINATFSFTPDASTLTTSAPVPPDTRSASTPLPADKTSNP